MWKFLMKLINPFMKWLLNSPLHGLVSRDYMLISVTGRKSGKVYTTPIQYRREGDEITVITSRAYAWWKNLQGGAPIRLRVQGQSLEGTAHPELDADTIRTCFRRVYPRATDAQVEQFIPRTVAISIRLAPASALHPTSPLRRV